MQLVPVQLLHGLNRWNPLFPFEETREYSLSGLRTFKKVELIVIIDATNGWIEDAKIVVLQSIFPI